MKRFELNKSIKSYTLLKISLKKKSKKRVNKTDKKSKSSTIQHGKITHKICHYKSNNFKKKL